MEGRLLEATVPFSWESVPDYLRYLRQGLGPNVASIVGHSMLRLYVMGAAAQEQSRPEQAFSPLAAPARSTRFKPCDTNNATPRE